MCDTLCSLPSRKDKGAALFAKNSDRSPNEPHLVIRVPARDYAAGSPVKLTYLTIPQAGHTLEAVLCKPSWTWGAEMGVNSAAVAIGNEAVFTRAKRGPDALTGMDLVRLALERSETAAEAVDLITRLLEEYGQGGNCGFDHKFYYDNSFLIVDPREGYVIETSGKRWVTEKVENRRAISNRLTIRKAHTKRGGVEAGFDFAGGLTEPLYTYFSGSARRLGSTNASLERPGDASGMMSALRRHFPQDEARVFIHGSVRSVCMHAGGVVGDQTTGSLVAELREGKPSTLWITGSSTPCISSFKPAFLGLESRAPVFEGEGEAKAYWLRREAVHRGVLAGKVDITALHRRIDELEKKWIADERGLFGRDVPDLKALSDFAREAAAEEERMIAEFVPEKEWGMPSKGRFNRYWSGKNALLEKPRI